MPETCIHTTFCATHFLHQILGFCTKIQEMQKNCPNLTQQGSKILIFFILIYKNKISKDLHSSEKYVYICRVTNLADIALSLKIPHRRPLSSGAILRIIHETFKFTQILICKDMDKIHLRRTVMRESSVALSRDVLPIQVYTP